MFPRLSFGVFSLLLVACERERSDEVKPVEDDPPVDADGDGVIATEDCDDDDPTAFPGGVEVCDEVDNDCNGTVDDGLLTTYYADADDDGYGDASVVTEACTLPAAHSTDSTDCGDDDADVHPGAPEVWYDGIDQDCDGRDDDQDQDGFGHADDCDDLDPAIHPDAVEIWYDGIDQDCDGAKDYDQDRDGFPLAGDCDDLDSSVRPDAIEIWYDGIDQDCDGADDYDQDRDGAPLASDCDDLDPSVRPDATEVWYDGIDQNCDGANDYDQDADGHDAAAHGGDDCNDLDAASYADVGSCVPDAACPAGWVQVPADHPSIQDAIDAAASGDSICVSAGTYSERIDFGGRDLVIESAEGAAMTTIDGGGAGSVVTLASGETTAAVLRGFTITGGEAVDGGGIYVDGSGATLDSLVIDDNEASSKGGGLYTLDSEVELLDVSFAGNAAAAGGGAFFDASEANWALGTVQDNDGGSYGGGASWYAGSTGSLTGVEFLSNVADDSGTGGGGALYTYDVSLDVTNVVMAGNVAYRGGGWYWYDEADVTLANVTFAGNEGVNGGAIFGWGSSAEPELVNVIVYANTASDQVGGIWVYSGGLELRYSAVVENSGTELDGVTGAVGADGNVDDDPEFIRFSTGMSAARWDLHLSSTSPLVGAGDPSIADADGTTSDIGAWAGPDADPSWYDDLDGDGLFDGWETAHGLDPSVDDAAEDGDGDGLDNAAEFAAGTDPETADTDGDGDDDGVELAAGDDPLDG